MLFLVIVDKICLLLSLSFHPEYINLRWLNILSLKSRFYSSVIPELVIINLISQCFMYS